MRSSAVADGPRDAQCQLKPCDSCTNVRLRRVFVYTQWIYRLSVTRGAVVDVLVAVVSP